MLAETATTAPASTAPFDESYEYMQMNPAFFAMQNSLLTLKFNSTSYLSEFAEQVKQIQSNLSKIHELLAQAGMVPNGKKDDTYDFFRGIARGITAFYAEIRKASLERANERNKYIQLEAMLVADTLIDIQKKYHKEGKPDNFYTWHNFRGLFTDIYESRRKTFLETPHLYHTYIFVKTNDASTKERMRNLEQKLSKALEGNTQPSPADVQTYYDLLNDFYSVKTSPLPKTQLWGTHILKSLEEYGTLELKNFDKYMEKYIPPANKHFLIDSLKGQLNSIEKLNNWVSYSQDQHKRHSTIDPQYLAYKASSLINLIKKGKDMLQYCNDVKSRFTALTIVQQGALWRLWEKSNTISVEEKRALYDTVAFRHIDSISHDSYSVKMKK